MIDPIAKQRREATIKRAELVVLHNKNAIKLVSRHLKYRRLMAALGKRRVRGRRMVEFLAVRVHQNQLRERFFTAYLRMPDDKRRELEPLDEFR